MNLLEVNELIAQLEREQETELLEFYKRKRAELIKKINEKINTIHFFHLHLHI